MKDKSWSATAIRRVLRWSLSARLLVESLATAVPLYFAAYLDYSVSETAALGRSLRLGIHATVFVVLLTLVIFVARYVTAVYQQLLAQEQGRVTVRLLAYAHLDRLLTRDARLITEHVPLNQRFTERFVASRDSLQAIVEAAYAAFEAAYGQAASTEERIDFEVTFMTKSYIDGHITIPAYANRDARAPRSMVLKMDRPEIYENTVTAMVYREPRPHLHIIEDTSDSSANYQELYPDQKQRIKSTVVFPVLAHTNELLGTLVVHCDRRNFFQRSDEKFWTDLFEIFAKRLALVKLKLDRLSTAANAETTAVNIGP